MDGERHIYSSVWEVFFTVFKSGLYGIGKHVWIGLSEPPCAVDLNLNKLVGLNSDLQPVALNAHTVQVTKEFTLSHCKDFYLFYLASEGTNNKYRRTFFRSGWNWD